MASVAEFFNMGGYAAFVWPAFGITALVMICLVLDSRKRFLAAEKTLRELEGNSADTSEAEGKKT